MLPKFLTAVFGSRNDRLLKTYRRSVERVNALEPQFEKLDGAALRAKTDEFRKRLADGATLDDILPEAFAVVREAGKRTLKMRHFDVQLVGGIALHQGKIAEMKTGEGKTLVATLPVYLNALAGKGVHVVTVNDYLARRDAEWMGRLYGFLGLTVGVNVPGMEREEKQAAFAADVTVSATKSDRSAVMLLGSLTVPAGTLSGQETFPLGGPGTQTVVSISVTAQSGGVPKIYTIIVNRAL